MNSTKQLQQHCATALHLSQGSRVPAQQSRGWKEPLQKPIPLGGVTQTVLPFQRDSGDAAGTWSQHGGVPTQCVSVLVGLQ